MTIKEFKNWVNNFPEEFDSYVFVVRDLNETEEEGKFGQKDEPIISSMVDQHNKRICVMNIESEKVAQKIRESLKKQKEENKSDEESKD